MVAGATGQTGRRILQRLAAAGYGTVGGVRNVERAEKSLGEEVTVLRGAMVDKVEKVSLERREEGRVE